MNNGKVRIYELSKELNLDNRDILAVCDQLNINVKSHSSTISDAEAARIRSAAEKYTPSHAPSNKSVTSTSNTSARSSNPQPPIKKQQILEIRKNRPLVELPKRVEAESSSPSASSTPPTVSPARPALKPNPNLPNRPVDRSNKAAVDNKPVEINELPLNEQSTEAQIVAAQQEVPALIDQDMVLAPSVPVEDEASSELSSSVPVTVDEPETTVVDEAGFPSTEVSRETVADQEAVEAETAPELVGPPVRPTLKVPMSNVQSATPAAAPSAPVASNRPILKRRGEQAEQQRSTPSKDTGRDGGRHPAKAAPDTSRPEVATPTRARQTTSGQAGDALASTAAPPKRVVELRRKPVRPGAGTVESPEVGTSEENPLIIPDPVKVLDGEVKRPTLSRPPKRGKAWEEEEEEENQKSGKAGVKSKRRLQPLLDDEEIELEEVFDSDDDDDAPMQVSLSLARPPKPKSAKAPQVKTTSTPTQKARKPSGSSDKNFRRDRREPEVKERPTLISLSRSLPLHDLAELLVVPETEIIRTLFFKGIAANINQILDIPTATMVAQELGVEIQTVEEEAEAKKVTEMLDLEDLENLQRRPPVVTIMGHVDHGKTTLLDSIRKTKVAQGEAGGITQHIGAYHVDVEHEGHTEQIVFLDTPGHEAFTAMRARGARVTDIAVLVVAADDGVRPQTVEAISHAKAAEVPIVVAINKIDKEEAQPDRVKQELTEFGLVAEEWGGDTIMVPVSALTGEHLDDLLEMLLLVSEVEDLHANPDRPARGTVIEANLDKARGPVATLLIQNGSLHVGDILVVGSTFGKVRAMIDDRGNRVREIGPSFPVEVLGLSDVPAAGDEFEVYTDEKEARAVADSRTDQQRQSRLQQAMASRRVSLNTISTQVQEGDLKELNLILKADVQGSVEAILAALQQLPQKEVQLRVLLAAPGEITETDVDLAAASSAVIIGFNTTFASGARQAADQAGVDVRDYNIIYKLLEDVQGAMEGLLEPELVEEPLGQVEVRAIFPVGRGTVAGCYVLSGKAIRNCKVRVRRRSEVVFEGNLDSLKRMKDDAREVNAGFECGIRIDSFNDWAEGDIIETYRLISKRRTLTT
jgi:translation initiation factor IF-2